MAEEAIKLGGKKKSIFIDKVKELLPEGGNLNLCLTCGACSSGCPATGLEGMDPRKFLRMAALGMDEEITTTKWVWMCSMCQRCIYVCPMKINIPQLVFYARQSWPRETRPKGIVGSCDMALRNDTCSAMGASEEDFQFVVEDVLEEYQESQPEFAEMQAPVNKQGAEFFLNQNSREPVTEPDEMVPLWKILHCRGRRLDLRHQGLGGGELLHVHGRRRGLEAHRRDQGQGGGGSGLQGLAQHRVRARTLRGPVRTAKVQARITTSRSKASSNTTPSGSGRANSRSAPTGTRSARSSSRSRTPASWSANPSATRWPRTCATWSGRWSVRKTSST